MKIKHILPFMAISFLTACGGQQAALTTGIDLNNLDTTAVPGTDFYQYACGGWMKAHPLTAEYSRFGSFDQLGENNNEQLRGLIEGVAAQQNAKGSIAEKIAMMYNSVMDSVSLNKQGLEPIRKELQSIAACYDKDELFRLYSSLQVKGVDGLFGFYIDADIKDSKNNLLSLHWMVLSQFTRKFWGFFR
jgi:putative endopeptidase